MLFDCLLIRLGTSYLRSWVSRLWGRSFVWHKLTEQVNGENGKIVECIQFSHMLSTTMLYCFSLPPSGDNIVFSLWIYEVQFFFFTATQPTDGLQLALQIEVLCIFLPFLLCFRRNCPEADDPIWTWFLGACGATSSGYVVSFCCKPAFTTSLYVGFLPGLHVKMIAWCGLKAVGHDFSL